MFSLHLTREARPEPRRCAACRRAVRTLRSRHAHEPARRRDEPVPPPARAQPRGLASMGRGGAGAGARRGPPDLPLHRLRGLPLVPRHGARVVRGSGDGGVPQRQLREHQGGPRGATGPGRDLHAGRAGPDRVRWVAHERLPDARWPALLWRHIFPEHEAPWPSIVPRRPGGGGRRLARATRRCRASRKRVGLAARADGPSRRRPRTGGCRGPGCRGLCPGGGVRCGERRLGDADEVPAADGARIPAPARGRRRRPGAPARSTLDRMAAGGIHDQLGGGFSRYATEPTWLVPHFEKMLSDNAQLARVYLHAWQLTRDARYLAVARSTLDFVARELTLPDGVFATSLDADTNGEEGATYTWTAGGIRDPLVAAGLGADVEMFAAAYDMSPGGNWEGRTILRRIATDAVLAARTGLPEAEVRVRLAEARAVLLAVRDRRPQPARDDKALAGWNGLMLAAFADAAAVFTREADPTLAAARRRYREIAERAGERLLAVLPDERGRLRRSWKDGQARHAGTLEDHACLADGLLALHEATANERWFTAACDLADTILARFVDPEGGFFDTADDAETLVARPRSVEDNALPSGNAMSVLVLLRLAALTGEGRYADAAEGALGLVGTAPARYPTAFAQWLVALDWRVGPVDEIALVGAPDDPRLGRLLDVVRAGFRPRQVVVVAPDPAASAVPLLQARFALRGLPTAFVCRGFACRQPVTEPEALAALLAG